MQPPLGSWRVQDPVILNPGSVPIESVSPIYGVTYAPPPAGVTSFLGQVAFRVVEHRSPVLTNFNPVTGTPRVVLRTVPKWTSRRTEFVIFGRNLHDRCAFYLSHGNGAVPLNPGDPLPSGPGVTNWPLTVLERALDWSAVRVALDFELDVRFSDPAQAWLQGPYRVVLRDEWIPAWKTLPGAFNLQAEPYPWFHGFSFGNERDGTQFDEFSSVYQWNAYDCVTPFGPFYGANPCLGCRSPSPWSLAFHSLVFTPWVEAMSGSCLGMAATSVLMARGDLPPASLSAAVRYAAGFSGNPSVSTNADTSELSTNYLSAPKPQEYRFRVCDYSEPVNLWAHIHRNQAVQTSSEFLNNILDQMDGAGLAPSVGGGRHIASIDGNPTNVLARIRTNPRDYVFCMQQSGDALKAHSMVGYAAIDGFGLDRTNIVSMLIPNSNSTALFVYDPNHPLDQTRFVEIDRVANRFFYHWGLNENVVTNALAGGGTEVLTNRTPDLWSGSACYASPISIWKNGRTMPGGDLLARGLALVLVGDADPAYEDVSGETWGWDSAGVFTDAYKGAKSVAPFGVNQTSNRLAWFFPPSNSPPALIRANVRGSTWRCFAAEAGRMLTLDVSSALAGTQDQVKLGTDPDGLLQSLTYRPFATATNFVPRLGILSSAKPSVVYEWLGLRVPGGQSVTFSALPPTSGNLNHQPMGAEFRNETGQTLSYSLRLLLNTTNELSKRFLTTNTFGPFVIPAGARHRIELLDLDGSTLRSLLDTDGDNRYDLVTTLAPLTPGVITQPPPPRLSICRSNDGVCLSWPITSESWALESSVVLGQNLAWRLVDLPPEISNGLQAVLLDREGANRAFGAPAGAERFFRLRRLPTVPPAPSPVTTLEVVLQRWFADSPGSTLLHVENVLIRRRDGSVTNAIPTPNIETPYPGPTTPQVWRFWTLFTFETSVPVEDIDNVAFEGRAERDDGYQGCYVGVRSEIAPRRLFELPSIETENPDYILLNPPAGHTNWLPPLARSPTHLDRPYLRVEWSTVNFAAGNEEGVDYEDAVTTEVDLVDGRTLYARLDRSTVSYVEQSLGGGSPQVTARYQAHLYLPEPLTRDQIAAVRTYNGPQLYHAFPAFYGDSALEPGWFVDPAAPLRVRPNLVLTYPSFSVRPVTLNKLELVAGSLSTAPTSLLNFEESIVLHDDVWIREFQSRVIPPEASATHFVVQYVTGTTACALFPN